MFQHFTRTLIDDGISDAAVAVAAAITNARKYTYAPHAIESADNCEYSGRAFGGRKFKHNRVHTLISTCRHEPFVFQRLVHTDAMACKVY